MKYKAGDKVRIKDDNWYWSNCDILGNIECGEWHFLPEHREYCGKVLMIVDVLKDSYLMENVGGRWTDEMIERLEPSNDVSKDRAVSVFEHLIREAFPNLIRCGDELKVLSDTFRKRLEE
jgi:hypothetical protein